MAEKTNTVSYFVKNISVVVGLVLIWRGVWLTLDQVDILAFAGDHKATALGGIILGVLILYLPDGDLKELQKL